MSQNIGSGPGFVRGCSFSSPAGCKTDDMPRRDWNTPSAHSRKPHHKAMNSPAHGQGHAKKRRAAKNRPDLIIGRFRKVVSQHRRREADDEDPGHRFP
jgi:hypothetical protein